MGHLGRAIGRARGRRLADQVEVTIGTPTIVSRTPVNPAPGTVTPGAVQNDTPSVSGGIPLPGDPDYQGGLGGAMLVPGAPGLETQGQWAGGMVLALGAGALALGIALTSE